LALIIPPKFKILHVASIQFPLVLVHPYAVLHLPSLFDPKKGAFSNPFLTSFLLYLPVNAPQASEYDWEFQAVVRHEVLKLSINIKYIETVTQIELNITQFFYCQGFSPEQF